MTLESEFDPKTGRVKTAKLLSRTFDDERFLGELTAAFTKNHGNPTRIEIRLISGETICIWGNIRDTIHDPIPGISDIDPVP